MPASFPLGLAYCGAPPLPDEIWSHWRLDPIVLTLLAAGLIAYLVGYPRIGYESSQRSRAVLFVSGWAVVTLALVSPLCPLSVSLFSARATQHVLLTLLGAPLIAASRPMRCLMAGIAGNAVLEARSSSPWTTTLNPLVAAGCFTIFLWLWHAPAPYESTFLSVAIYWCMHASLFLTACWLWSTLLRASETNVFSAVLASIVSSVQMGLLGALITLAPRAFYVPHFQTTDAWGLTPLQDQQLGGVIMWVPGCTVFLIVGMLALARCLFAGRRVVVAATTRITTP